MVNITLDYMDYIDYYTHFLETRSGKFPEIIEYRKIFYDWN